MASPRYEDMRSTAAQLQLELERLEKLGSSININKHIFELLKKRLAGSPIRAYFVQKMYHYILEMKQQKRWKWRPKLQKELALSQKLPFVFEVVITIQYLHNQILDGKSEVTTPKRIKDNLLAANQLKDLLYEYIDTYFSAEQAASIRQYVRECFKVVDLGQFIEKEANTFERFMNKEVSIHFPPELEQQMPLECLTPFLDKIKSELPLENWDFTLLYFKRIYLTCGALFVMATELLIQLCNVDVRSRPGLINFAVCYGMMRQIINDNADMVPSKHMLSTHSKSHADAFSDLRNRNVTLPLIFHFSEVKKSPVYKFLQRQKESITKEEESKISATILQSHALYKSIQNCKILATLSRGFLNLNFPSAALLADSCEIAYWNRYLYPCLRHKQYKKYKKTHYYRRTKAFIQAVEASFSTTKVRAPKTHALPLGDLVSLNGAHWRKNWA